jgi:threonine synthase
VSRARELGVERIAMPTNGNAGSAWATYAARAGMGATIVMPLEAPSICRRECVAAGADLRLVDGLIGDAGRRVAELIAESNGAIFDAGTLREPYRLEGKKTMGYEIVEQLGWQTPDVIIYPTGGGVGLIGIHKALHELRELGWIGDKLPRLVAVSPPAARRSCGPSPPARIEPSRGRTRTLWRSASRCRPRWATS